jgi:GNAT superfamily N-acetyltransferase
MRCSGRARSGWSSSIHRGAIAARASPASGKGVARAILAHLHVNAARLGYMTMRLETGDLQIPAMGLYESYGFSRIEPFGDYVNDATSVCFALNFAEHSVVSTA